MSQVANKSKKLLTNAAILVSKPKNVIAFQIQKWLKLTLPFEESSISPNKILMENVPKYPEFFETGLFLVGFNTMRGDISSLAKYWTVEYIVGGVLGIKTKDFYIESHVLDRRPYSFVTPNILEYSLSQFTGQIIQKYPPTLVNLRSMKEIKMRRKNMFDDSWSNEEDYLKSDDENSEDEENIRWNIGFSGKSVYCNSIQLIHFSPPNFILRVKCELTFSCRALVNDIGNHLGCNATMTSLHVQRLGPFDYDKDESLEKHELHIEQIKRNIPLTSEKCKDYLHQLRSIYPAATRKYRIL